ncbi:hypothetical protein F4802DRAFT_591590 [Xylaria palmicola]|nr:hypothetical protein F4802DRAFT_591590 [Xylaria palmicola]
MGADEAWLINTLQGILPEQTLQLLHDHFLHPSSTMNTVSSYLVVGAKRTAQALAPVLSPLAERGALALQESTDVVFFLAVLTLLFLAFKIVVCVQRTISYFTRLAFRAALWALLGLALMAVWQRGPEAVARDLAVLAGRAVRYAAVVRDIWLAEYQKYDAQTRAGTTGASGSFGSREGSTGSAGYSGTRRGR